MPSASRSCRESEMSSQGVLGLLRLQAALYARLEGLAQRQRSLVTEEDTGPLLTLLGARQRVAAQLAALAARLEPVRGRWKACRAGLSSGECREADQLLDEMNARLRRVMESDERDARLLAARRQQVTLDLGRTQTASTALAAYQTRGGGRAIDVMDDA